MTATLATELKISSSKWGLKCEPNKSAWVEPPTWMTLHGKISYQFQCKGAYELVCNGFETGCPVWRHATNDRWIVRHQEGLWIVQSEKNLGRNDVCFMRLRDDTVSSPDHSNVSWEEFNIDVRRWVRAAAFCFEDKANVRPLRSKAITCADCLSEPEKAGSRCFACAAKQ